MSEIWEATKDVGRGGAEVALGLGAFFGARLLLATGVGGLFVAAGNLVGIATSGTPFLSVEGLADAVVPNTLGDPTELQASIALGAGSVVVTGLGAAAVETVEG